MPVEELGIKFVVEGLGTYIGSMKRAEDANEGVEKSAEKTSGILNNALAVALGQGIVGAAEMAYGALIKVGGAVVDVSKESIGLATEFQTSITILKGAASDSALSFDELHDAAIKVGADSDVLGASATGAAEAMTTLYMAGLQDAAVFGDIDGYMANTAELGGILKASFDLAAASELDVAAAADLGVVALSTYGSTISDAASQGEFAAASLDNIVKAANASNMSVTDVAEALKYAGPNAAAFGMSLEDTNVALALLSNAGIKGSMAGTTLASVMRDMQKETDQSVAAWDALGISIYDNEGNTRELTSIIGDLNVALAGKTDEQRASVLQDIFTSESMKGLNILLGEGVTGWDDMSNAISNATGMQEQAASRSETFAGQMEALDGQVETLKIQFGEALLPALSSFIEAIIPIIDQYGPQLADAFSFIGDMLLGVIDGFIAFFGSNPAGGIAEIGEVIGAVFGEGAQDAFLSFTGWLNQAIPDALLFAQGIIQQFSDFFATISPIIDGVVQNIVDFWNALKENASIIWTGIQLIISGFTNIVLGIVTTFLAVFSGNWDVAWAGIQQILQGAWDAISGIVTTALGIILSLLETNLATVTTTIAKAWVIVKTVTSAAWESIKTWLSSTWENIKETSKSVWESIKTTVQSISESIKTFVTTTFESIKTTATTVWEGVKTAISTAIEGAKTIVVDTFEGIKTYLSGIDLTSIGSDIVGGIINGISAAVGGIADALIGGVQGAIDGARNLLQANSPSKLTEDLIGAPIGLGAAVGIEKTEPVIQSALANAIMPNVSGIAPASIGYNYVTNAPNYSRTSTTHQNFNLTPDMLLETVGATSGQSI